MPEPDVFTIARGDLQHPRNCTTLITGGVAGIGLETALLLHDLDTANRIIIVDRAAKAECKAPASFLSSDRVLFLQCDITDWEALRNAFEAGVQQFRRIDHVFVNAGIIDQSNQLLKDELDHNGKLKRVDKRVLSVDLDSVLDTIKLAIHHQRRTASRSEPKCIVVTASLAGYIGSADSPLYGAAKAGVVGLVRSLKNDLAKLNIAISLVAPGITVTELVLGRKEGESPTDWAKRMRAVGVPINSPGEVADAVVYLLGQGMNGSGKGLLIQAAKIVDVEKGLAINRKSWLSTTMVDFFKSGRNALLVQNKL